MQVYIHSFGILKIQFMNFNSLRSGLGLARILGAEENRCFQEQVTHSNHFGLGVLLLLSMLVFQKSWVENISYEGNFKVFAPGEMTHRQISKDTPVGELTYHSMFYEAGDEDDNALYLISWVDYPEGSLHSDSVDLVKSFLDATVETAVLNVDGKLMYQSDEKVQGFPARYWRIDYNNGTAVIKTRAFVAGRRFYSLQVASKKVKNLNSAVDQFFDSFKLLSVPEK